MLFMQKLGTYIVLFSLNVISISAYSVHDAWKMDVYPIFEPRPVEGDVGEPLYLSPLIAAGRIDEARDLATVRNLSEVQSYSGYFTVNEEYNSNLFFWFFPSEGNYADDPVLLWLQGGPGSSSLYGLFTENGPFTVETDYTLKLNPFSWNKNHSVIYIDNPVGTGYSFTDDDAGYANTEDDVGRDLYSALTQFFTLFPELQQNEFYVTGESYGGMYIPAIGYKIHVENPNATLKINLQGLALGNAVSDRVSMLNYADHYYQLGFIDANFTNHLHQLQDEAVIAIQEERYLDAFHLRSEILGGFSEQSGDIFMYNFLYATEPVRGGNHELFVQQDNVRIAIHVGNTTYSNGDAVYDHLAEDTMKTVKPWVEVLLDNYRVLYYSGQLDLQIPYSLSLSFYQTLNFSAGDEYATAHRWKWYVGDELAGYAKSAGLFTELLVRNAGHMVPTDQPKWALDLIQRFTSNQNFTDQY